MKVKYFGGTDTLYIELRKADVTETRDLDENTLIDIDLEGHICAITIEHASVRADIPHFSFEQIPAPDLA
ncbi:MAG: DUF2283 domain-containing protein [Leptospirales bacterium]